VRTQNNIRINQLFTSQFPQQQQSKLLHRSDGGFFRKGPTHNRVKLRSDSIRFVSATLKLAGRGEIQFGAAGFNRIWFANGRMQQPSGKLIEPVSAEERKHGFVLRITYHQPPKLIQ
jgi:hypothetical protein